jgi:tetratricopeptide (TPR) repeat protein
MRYPLMIGALLAASPLVGAVSPELNRDKLLKAVEALEVQHRELTDEISQIKSLLGVDPALEDLPLLAATAKLPERVRVRVEDGVKAYKDSKYEQAKDLFQTAWEEAPDNSLVHFNLGMAYQKLGNVSLAKKMLKTAVELDPKIPSAEKIKAFLAGKITDLKKGEDELSEEERSLKNTLTNLQHEANSYMKSRTLPLPKRRSETVKLLREIISKAAESEKIQREFLPAVAESYALFDMHEDALLAYADYEKSMNERILPEGYHTKKLHIEERQEEERKVLKGYLGNEPGKPVRRRLLKDREELGIFAAQIEEFVAVANETDPDFKKITRRLGEYRWGNRPGRHVVVVNRYEEILYSSLSGTLAIDRYQDENGQKFFRNITRLAPQMETKQTEFVEVNLTVNGESVPYVLLYAYIPKHEAFIIVRLPKQDLQRA